LRQPLTIDSKCCSSGPDQRQAVDQVRTRVEARMIGHQLNRVGGMRLMVSAAERAGELSETAGSLRTIERLWHGIGDRMGYELVTRPWLVLLEATPAVDAKGRGCKCGVESGSAFPARRGVCGDGRDAAEHSGPRQAECAPTDSRSPDLH
jgi:hypothetical protein